MQMLVLPRLSTTVVLHTYAMKLNTDEMLNNMPLEGVELSRSRSEEFSDAEEIEARSYQASESKGCDHLWIRTQFGDRRSTEQWRR